MFSTMVSVSSSFPPLFPISVGQHGVSLRFKKFNFTSFEKGIFLGGRADLRKVFFGSYVF